MDKENAGLNLVGALALRISDLQREAAVNVSGLSPKDCACLVSVAHQDTPQTITDISVICELSHSAAVRLVSRLELAGYVQKVSADIDRREIYVSLTHKGYEMRDSILSARRSAIKPIFSMIPRADREVLERSASIILSGLTNSRVVSEQICRLCDAVACGGNDCPVEKKALHLEATATAGFQVDGVIFRAT